MDMQLMMDILKAIKDKDPSAEYIDDANMVRYIEDGELRYGQIRSHMQYAREQCWIESLESEDFRDQFVAATKLTLRGEQTLIELNNESQRIKITKEYGKIHSIDNFDICPPKTKNGKFYLIIGHVTKDEKHRKTIRHIPFDIEQLDLVRLKKLIHSVLEAHP